MLVLFVIFTQSLHRFVVLLRAGRRNIWNENPLAKVSDIGHEIVDLIEHTRPLLRLLLSSERRWPIVAIFSSQRAFA